MPKDFALSVDALTGEVDFVYDETTKNFVIIDDCRNNLILSVMMAKKSFFAAPEFGSTHGEIKKNTAEAQNEIAERIRKATQWIINSGRCSEILIETEADESDPGKIKIEITGKQTDGRDVPFTTFLRVI